MLSYSSKVLWDKNALIYTIKCFELYHKVLQYPMKCLTISFTHYTSDTQKCIVVKSFLVLITQIVIIILIRIVRIHTSYIRVMLYDTTI